MGKYLDMYVDSNMEIQSIRIKTMTAADLERYFAAGEQNIAVLERAFDEMKQWDERMGHDFYQPPLIPMPYKLPDMYMRYGRWDDALRVYEFCRKISYLYEYDFDALEKSMIEKKLCAELVEALILSDIHSQKHIKKRLNGQVSAEAINWVLRFYHRFERVKNGNDYYVRLRTEI